MSEFLEKYRELEGDLANLRWLNGGVESAEEEPILDEMEALWHDLSAEEQDMLNKENAQTLMVDDPADRAKGIMQDGKELVDVDIRARPGSPVREYVDSA